MVGTKKQAQTKQAAGLLGNYDVFVVLTTASTYQKHPRGHRNITSLTQCQHLAYSKIKNAPYFKTAGQYPWKTLFITPLRHTLYRKITETFLTP